MSNYKNEYNSLDTNTSWSLAEKFIRKKTTILEVGAGNGNFAEAMAITKHCKVDTIEPDKNDALLINNVRRVINDNLENVIDSLETHSYDTVVFLDVIEHLVDPVSVLRDIRRVLKKNGSVIFSIPNMAHMSVRLMLLSGSFDYGKTGILDQTHLHFYTKKEITRIFFEAGYIIDTLDGVVENIEDEIIFAELNNIGIHEVESMKAALYKNDGVIYQFVGKAVPGISRKMVLPACSPNTYEMRDHYYKKKTDAFKK